MHLTVSLLAFLALLAAFGLAHADSLLPKKASAIVTLTTTLGGNVCLPNNAPVLDNQILPDGTIVPFTIPAGKVLVLTGVDWSAVNAASFTNLRTIVFVRPDVNTTVRVFQTGAFANGDPFTGSALIPNVVVKTALLPCLFVDGGGVGNGGIVHGFLADDD